MLAIRARSGLLCLLALFCAACAPKRESGLPDGALFAGDADALRRVLLRLERLAETPLAREARVVRDRLEGCKEFVASTPDGDAQALLESIHCDAVAALAPPVRALLGERQLVLIWPLPQDGRIYGAIAVSEDASLVLDATLELEGASGLASLVLPGEAAAGPAVLAQRDTLVRARLRPEAGIRIASLVPQGSQADTLFRLKSELFAGAVLDGTWEAAVYLPEPGSRMPGVALALGTRASAPAVAAAEKFVSDLRATWDVAREPLQLGGHRGACLANLRILPEFAPCYVVTERALVAGWNVASLSQALAESAAGTVESGAELVVHLDRFPEADERLRQALAPSAPPTALAYAWSRAALEASRQGDVTRIRVELESGAAQ